MAEIVLEDVNKVFADGTEAVHDFNLDIPDGQFVVLVGPSGCGKTTVLRMVAGLEDLTSGNIGIGGRLMNDVPPGERDVAMVFQNYALYPHMTVFQNIALSLRIRKINKAEMRRRVEDAARILHLEGVLNKRPRELSGGQRQRVAMGRAIVREPQAFLMDEPLSNLDAKLRVQMRGEILRIQRELGVTTIYVTHDQTEAVTLGDQVAVMRRGVLQQVAAPLALYARPANVFVAGFIGSPSMNLVEARFHNGDAGAHVEFAGLRLRVPDEVIADRPALAAYDGRSVILGIRPEHMDDAALVSSAHPDDRLPVTVELLDSVGSDVYLYFPIDAPPVLTEDTIELASDIDDEALADLKAAAGENRNLFVARADAETDARIGQRREIFVNTAKLHFFDAATGQAIYDGTGEVAERAMSELSA